MKRTALFTSTFFAFSSFAVAHAGALDGTWHVNGSVQDNPVTPVCILTEKDGKITGTCQGTDGKPVPVTGTVKDKEIKWQYDTAYQGSGITIFFTGKFDKDDHLSGGIYVDPYAVDGSFTATRDKAAAAPAAPSAPSVPSAPPAA